MTKTELLTILASKYTLVGQEVEEGTDDMGGGNVITRWNVRCYGKEGNIAIRRLIYFFTDQNDNAYWRERVPVTSDQSIFFQDLNDYIVEKINDNTYKFIGINHVILELKKAYVTATKPDNSKKEAIVTQDEAGNFTIDVVL